MKMRARVLGWRVMLVLWVGLLAMAGCGGREKPASPLLIVGDPPSATTCLTRLQQVYQERSDVSKYAGLLAQDYTFVFAPFDHAGENPTPPQWGLAEELESTENMFAAESVTSISLTYTLSDPLASELYPGTWKVEMRNIELRLETRKEDGSPMTVMVTDGACDFYLKEFPDPLTSRGWPTWKIWRWEDLGIQVRLQAKGTQKTWGQLKNFFR
jgi:hypothetical protein